MSDSALLVGGRYRLIKTIGQGGMGTVWQAHDEVLGRDVAVKEIHPPPDLTDPERDVFSVRTFREARAAGRVAHPGVATVYDVLEEHGHPWIVMQLIHSRTLGELVRDDGPMLPADAADIGVQLLEALRAAHAAGVLHRDVKPDNVLLTEDGRAVLTDFGIATTEGEAPVTRTGVLLGTPAFMAPERAAGGEARVASDLWAMGATLYFAVEGHSPFQRPHALATLGAVLHAEPAPMARAGMLAPVILGLLRKDPAERMTLDEAEHRLQRVMISSSVESTAPVVIPVPPEVPVRDAAAEAGAMAGPGAMSAPGPVDEADPAAGPATAAPRRQRRPPLTAVAACTVALAVLTAGAAWWTNRQAGVRTPTTVPAVVRTSSVSPSGPTPAATRAKTQPTTSPTTYRNPVRQGTAPPTGRTGEPTPTPTGTPTKKKPTEKASATPSKTPKKNTKTAAKPTTKATTKATGPAEVPPADDAEEAAE
ncbi:serine/threonine-protein kinase [Nonomuraea sp. NEAU-A123]|uniref:serine/threonine-protein kinase n=1 Tax=Nonomuraea sp. NEAU-A123 TaxID=2839649 RepID=UPI001BE4379B|nr:serine/threonine-protein kinase [Nonomuraea sp. NEAU-A123]MBT2228739.1 serine/threonine protein kinase [Nonomuraea sp. NEAU-A123]